MQAFEAATVLDPIRGVAHLRNTSRQLMSSENEKNEYSLGWRIFSKKPYRGDELVSFLNEITDLAFAAAKPHLATMNLELGHHFVAPEDKHHVVALHSAWSRRGRHATWHFY